MLKKTTTIKLKSKIIKLIQNFPRLFRFLSNIKRRYFPRLFRFLSNIKRRCFPSPITLPNTELKRFLETYAYPQAGKQRLFLDISVLILMDHGTGIQRVVRNTLFELLNNPLEDYRVEPVYGSEDGLYRYAHSDEIIQASAGDIFLGLDLITSWIPRHKKTFNEFKTNGAKLYFIIYDLIPILHPHFFQKDMRIFFNEWLKQIIKQADGAICISQTVANELSYWIAKNYPKRKNFQVGWFHLGANLDSFLKAKTTKSPIAQSITGNSILMVSTIEPRKGYALALSAFEEIWKKDTKVNLIIVGKLGWDMDVFIQKIKNHPEKNKQLFWFENASDAELSVFYNTYQGLLMASESEGFGLALIEAAHHKLPILVRDIPVFREVAGDYARYFPKNSSPVQLATIIENWLLDIENHQIPSSENISWQSWLESTKQLVNVVRCFSKKYPTTS